MRHHSNGITFRVWAPHAKKVYVTGSFNDWKKTTERLYSERNGYWSGDVPTAKMGDEYLYQIYARNGDKLRRNDPYARLVTNSIGNTVNLRPARL